MDNTMENTFDELVQLKQEGKIGWREFIRRQPDVEQEYYAWCVGNDVDMNEETAEEYMMYIEERLFK